MNDLAPEPRPEVAHSMIGSFNAESSHVRNSTAETASMMITSVIAVTTELVVPWPRLSVLGLIRRPKWHAIRAMNMPNTTPLAKPSQRLEVGTAAGRLLAK